MKKPKFKYVKSEQENGCAVACMAMILGMSYWDVEKYFINDFDKEGIKIEKSINFLSENGVDVIRKAHYGYYDRERTNKRMIQPFADIHYVSFQQFTDVDFNHAVIMLRNGKIVCPTKKFDLKAVALYEIQEVLGCYYEQ